MTGVQTCALPIFSAIEKTAKYAIEGRSRAAHPTLRVAVPGSADARPPSVRQKVKVLDADEGKRGSTASQYDNVPGDSASAALEQALERARSQSPRGAAYAHSPRRHAEPSSSPSGAPNAFTFKIQYPGCRCEKRNALPSVKAYVYSQKTQTSHPRSEERRVGKECLRLCRSRWSPYH